jgi:hypothetical protein
MEDKLINDKNSRLKEWIPIYGIYQAFKNISDKKPSVIRDHDKLVYYVHLMYQGTFAALPFYGLAELLMK